MTGALIIAVKKMRHAQKEYFKTKSKHWLSDSKRLEKQVDQLLQDHENTQQDLFQPVQYEQTK